MVATTEEEEEEDEEKKGEFVTLEKEKKEKHKFATLEEEEKLKFTAQRKKNAKTKLLSRRTVLSLPVLPH